VFLRVSRTWLAAHCFAAPAPTFDLSIAALAVFARFASRPHYRVGLLPSRTSSLPRSSRPSARPAPHRVRKGTVCRSGSSREVCRPFSARGWKRPPTAALCMGCFVPTSPFLTTSPVCSASNRPGISPGGTRGVCCPSGSLPIRRGGRRLRRPHPLMTLSRWHSPFRALRPKPPLATSMRLQGLSPANRPYPPVSGFP